VAEDYRGGEPTNHYAANRPYCAKHGRAKLDIGGEKKCIVCLEEERQQAQAKACGKPSNEP
jgi:hypothetical protein